MGLKYELPCSIVSGSVVYIPRASCQRQSVVIIATITVIITYVTPLGRNAYSSVALKTTSYLLNVDPVTRIHDAHVLI